MNFNLYLDDGAASRLDKIARQTRTPRNALVRQAVAAWLDRRDQEWPEQVFKLIPAPELEPFESHRVELREPADDPLENSPRRAPRPAGRRRRVSRRTR